MRKRVIKIGSLSLVLGLALFSLSFLEGFNADAVTGNLSNGILIIKICVVAGIALILFSVGCFIVAVSADQK